MRRSATQSEREEALLLLASFRCGDLMMAPEPWHLVALVELLEEEPHAKVSLPMEYWILPLAGKENVPVAISVRLEQQPVFDRSAMERLRRFMRAIDGTPSI